LLLYRVSCVVFFHAAARRRAFGTRHTTHNFLHIQRSKLQFFLYVSCNP
jgi:hypothetical protein